MLSRDEILSKAIVKQEVVNIPELGGDIIVSEMTGAERENWENSIEEKGRRTNLRAKLLVASLVDESGSRLFSQDDIEAVSKLPFSIIEKLCDISSKLNGFTSKEIDTAEKN